MSGEQVPVIQADRDAAASALVHADHEMLKNCFYCAKSHNSRHYHTVCEPEYAKRLAKLTQAFARHRLASQSTPASQSDYIPAASVRKSASETGLVTTPVEQGEARYHVLGETSAIGPRWLIWDSKEAHSIWHSIADEELAKAFARALNAFTPVDAAPEHHEFCSAGVGPRSECHICQGFDAAPEAGEVERLRADLEWLRSFAPRGGSSLCFRGQTTHEISVKLNRIGDALEARAALSPPPAVDEGLVERLRRAVLYVRHRAAGSFDEAFSGLRGQDYDRGVLDSLDAMLAALTPVKAASPQVGEEL